MTGCRYEVLMGELDGRSAAFVVPVIPEGAPSWVREGIARRRLAVISGQCACGGRRPRLNRQQRRAAGRRGDPVGVVEVVHLEDCPAIAPALEQYLSGWAA